MASSNGLKNLKDEPIYNSRIMKGYLQYLSKYFPDVNIDTILEHAGMTRYAVEDQGHWFTQTESDRFQEVLVQKTENPKIAREVGRNSVSAGAMGVAKQYSMGFMKLTTIYLLMEKIYPILSRAAKIKVNKLGSNQVEIISKPETGVDEKPYQCEYRMGSFESVGTLFTKMYAKVEHPTCYHKGDDCCRYIVTWEEPGSFMWKRIRNYSLLGSLVATVGLYFALPFISWLVSILIFAYITMTVSIFSSHLEKEELARTIETQGDSAKNLLDEMNIRYNNAL